MKVYSYTVLLSEGLTGLTAIAFPRNSRLVAR